MPGSEKVLLARKRAENRANGIGDKDGKLSHLNKKAETTVKCTQCSSEIRATKKNIEAGQHASSRHPEKTFLECFPGATPPETAGGAKDGGSSDGKKPKVDLDRVRAEAAEKRSLDEGGKPKKAVKKKEDDLGDLFAAIDVKGGKKKK
jgi:hypothetical protein